MLRQSIQQIPNEWQSVLSVILDTFPPTTSAIEERIRSDLDSGLEVYPPLDMVFEAFKYFKPNKLSAVILGQDPYANPGEAQGLCFSVPQGTRMPPSLRNIFKELDHEFDEVRTNTDLHDWAEQGVLLLNRALTVKQANPNSHKKEWHPFTEAVIKWINQHTSHVVFILWGNDARSCKEWIDPQKHLILEHTHPSPLSRTPFVGNKHFMQCNEYLIKHNKLPIKWV